MDGESVSALFVNELRRALHSLYDPAELRKSPLVELLGASQVQDPSSSLRRILVNAIESLKPAANVPPQSSAWRMYHILLNRYIEQFAQKEVATDLTISIRQLRRQEQQALRALADYLCSHHDLRPKVPGQLNVPSHTADQTLADVGTPSREQELEWLRESIPSEPVDAEGMIQAALKAVGPLIEALGVRAEYSLPENLPRLAVQLTAMRQALLNVLTAAVHCVPGGRVSIKAEALRWDVCVNIRPLASHVVSSSLSRDDLERLEMARQLVELAGGSLAVMPGQDQKQPFNVRLVLSAAEQISVLVIDDNADTLQLLQRYLTGTRYRFVGVRDPDRVFALAEELSPQMIVLDVMLPRVDGWELMGRLREHPQTRGVPVVVCTILPQEELAFTLGAAGFIRKPINRKSFLSALDRQVSLLPRESC